MLCEIPRSACPSRPGGGGGVPLGCVPTTTGIADTVRRTHVLGLGRCGRTRREGFGEDAPFEELSIRELRGGISKRDFPWVGSAGGLWITKIFMQPKWNCSPEGVFGKKHNCINSDIESCVEGVCCGSMVHGRHRAQWHSLCVDITSEARREIRDNRTE